jgi:hypothetical protein
MRIRTTVPIPMYIPPPSFWNPSCVHRLAVPSPNGQIRTALYCKGHRPLVEQVVAINAVVETDPRAEEPSTSWPALVRACPA